VEARQVIDVGRAEQERRVEAALGHAPARLP
jgi:hypothetical protein